MELKPSTACLKNIVLFASQSYQRGIETRSPPPSRLPPAALNRTNVELKPIEKSSQYRAELSLNRTNVELKLDTGFIFFIRRGSQSYQRGIETKKLLTRASTIRSQSYQRGIETP